MEAWLSFMMHTLFDPWFDVIANVSVFKWRVIFSLMFIHHYSCQYAYSVQGAKSKLYCPH